MNEKGGVRCGSELVAGASSCLSLKAPRAEDGWEGRVLVAPISTLTLLALSYSLTHRQALVSGRHFRGRVDEARVSTNIGLLNM